MHRNKGGTPEAGDDMTDNAPKKALFIVPAYNECANIAQVLDDLLSVAGPEQILVVNDASEDATLAVIRRYPVKYIDFPFNLGVASVLKIGFQHALKNNFALAVQFDGDGQHVAAEAAKIAEAIRADICDVAIGSRAGLSEHTSSLARRVGSKFISGILVLLTGQYISDPTSGFRAYSLAAIQKFARDFPDEYPEVESIVLAKKFGLRVKETSVTMRPRQAGSSSITIFGSIYYLVKVILASCIILLRKY